MPAVPRTVVALGLTSLFTDVSAEMVSTVLPLYFIVYLGLSPIQFGLVDGLYQGAGALVRVASGFAADRTRRAKEIAFIGYAISALCKLGLLVAGGSAAITAVVVADRTGKGLRTAPRDALISLNAPREQLATAFGVHRALDTFGAMLGPLLAFGLLTLAPGAFDAVFVVSFCAALIGLGVLWLFVEPARPRRRVTRPPEPPSLRAAVGLLADPRFRGLAIAGTALSLLTVSDGFLFLVLQQRLSLAAGLFPLLYVGTSLVYFALALPVGRLADRVGRTRVFLGGYALVPACLAALLFLPAGGPTAALVLALFGAYYAATDGVLMALGSAVLPESLRGTGLGLLTTATSSARLLSSVLFGAVWTWWGMETSLLVFALGMVGSIAVAGFILSRIALTQVDSEQNEKEPWLRHRGCTTCPRVNECLDQARSAESS
ncbi:MAG TPA: MFS transporter [Chloroflexota bacterium]|jgi:MFS family permease|nr:MFS transporter [Chloroflexota bacterium]